MKTSILRIMLLGLPILAFGQQASGSPYTDPARLAALIEKRKDDDGAVFYLVDVRTPEEYREGHIPTALNIPVTIIGSKPPTEKKDALIVLYCRSGARSGAALQTLERLGYTRVVNFGAVSRWRGELLRGDSPGAN